MINYNPMDWYWIVAGDETQVYSSKSGDYVPATDTTYQAWVASGGVPTRILNADELAEVLANASVRPGNADMLDRYKGAQANKLTMEVVAKVLFNHENRIRQAAGQQTVTAAQFIARLKEML